MAARPTRLRRTLVADPPRHNLSEDSAAAIADAVTELVTAFHASNDAGPQAIRLVIFSATPDLRAAKPAVRGTRRRLGQRAIPLPRRDAHRTTTCLDCIRALLIVDRGRGADPLRPVYINGTQSLRPDLGQS